MDSILPNNRIRVALADDQHLMRQALAALINSFGNCEVIFEAGEGQQVISAIEAGKVPDVLLLDLSMPGMDGYETMKWLNGHCPSVRVLMLTMYDAEPTYIRMLNAGVSGLLKKDIHPNELKLAIERVVKKGSYNCADASGKLLNLFRHNEQRQTIRKNTLSEAEVNFLRMLCSELTYKEIAQTLVISSRSIDQLREALFMKLDAKSRIGLVMFAMRSGLVPL